MATDTLVGNDLIILDDRTLADLPDGDTCVLEFPNNIAEVKAGKNGNVIYAFNAQGKISTVKVRVLLGSADDKFINSRYQSYLQDPPAFTLMTGEFTKRVGDGSGNVSAVVYQFVGGIPQKPPGAKENMDGDAQQAVAEWTLTFGNTDRSIT